MGKQYKFTNNAYAAIADGEYDIPSLISPKTVLDIGANEGAFTAWVQKRWPSSKVIAYEPMPENAALFKENHGDSPNVDFYQLAVHDGMPVRMFFGNNSGCCSMYDIGEQKRESIEVKSVDAASLPRCEYVKVDTEGNEVRILNALDLSETKWLSVEYHRDSDIDTIQCILESKGFKRGMRKALAENRGILTFQKGVEDCSVFLAMPVYRWADAFTMQALLKFVAKWYDKGGFNMDIRNHIGECPIGRARNELTYQFLQSDKSHILFVDSDIVFDYNQVKKLLFSGKDIIGGVYVMKKEGKVHPVCNTLNEVGMPDENGHIEMKYMGTGFLCIHRRVFEKMIEKMGNDLAYISDMDGKTEMWDFWRMGVYHDPVVNRKRWLSEDWQFCQFARECGFKIWMDAQVLVNHSGMAMYPLSYQLNELYTPEQLKLISEQGKT